MRLPHDVRIVGCTNGYIVSVGCQTFVFTSRTGLVKELSEYLDDPRGKMNEYASRFGILVDADAPNTANGVGRLVSTGEMGVSDLNERYVPGPALNQCQERRR
jgi:hypothetical protein